MTLSPLPVLSTFFLFVKNQRTYVRALPPCCQRSGQIFTQDAAAAAFPWERPRQSDWITQTHTSLPDQ